MDRLVNLLRGSSKDDLMALAKPGPLFNLLLHYDPLDASCYPIGPDSGFPWPLVFLAGRWHRKHLLPNRALPKLSHVRDAVHQFANKVKWKSVLEDAAQKKPSIMVKSRRTPDYVARRPLNDDQPMKQLQPEVTAWASRVSGMLIKAASDARDRARSCGLSYGSRPKLVDFAISCLRSREWRLLPNDKDGGYSLTSREDLCAETFRVLRKEWYSELDPLCVNMKSILIEYRKLANAIGELEEEPDLATSLKRSLDGGSIFTTLRLTCKSHKGVGRVGCRNLHTAPRYAFAGNAAWIQKQLMPMLRSLDFLLFTTTEFAEKIARVEAGPDDFYIKADVKDFFLSGVPDNIVNISTEHMVGERKALARRVLKHLLDHQFVTTPFAKDRLWQCVRGTGMGLPHSSATSDAAFYNKVEVGLLPKLKRYGVKAYFRYRDDVFMIANDRTCLAQLGEDIRLLAGYFIVELEVCRDISVTFLDVEVIRDGSRYITRPYFKPSALRRPLGEDSLHLRRLHLCWPCNVVRSIFLRSTRLVDALTAKEVMINRFISFGASSQLIERLRSINSGNTHRLPRRLADTTSWVVLPNHPVWNSALQREFDRLMNDEYLISVWRDGHNGAFYPKFGISWKNCLKPIWNRLC